jgi:hypothetical protein
MQLNVRLSMFSFTRTEILLLLSFLFGSFGVALWLTAPDGPLSFNRSDTPAKRLPTLNIATEYALNRQAQDLGLHTSPGLTGYVDSLVRLDRYTVSAKGWLADRGGEGAPSYIFAYVGGAFVGSARTYGQRSDVTQALNLTGKARQNIAYAMTFRCGLGYLPVLVGLSADRYTQLKTKPCP